jgi:hypothetical protein
MHRLRQQDYEIRLEIWSCHGSKYKYCGIIGCDVIYMGRQVPAFPKDLLSYSEYERCIFLRKLGSSLPNYTVSLYRRQQSFENSRVFLDKKIQNYPSLYLLDVSVFCRPSIYSTWLWHFLIWFSAILSRYYKDFEQYLRAWGSVVVKALRYKSEGPGIDSRCRRGFSRSIWQLHVPWGRLSL